MTKVLAIVLAATMAVGSLAGCSSDKKAEEKSGSTIKVGTSGPLTGGNAVYGNAVARGLELGFEEINAKGGLQFEVSAQDDEADPSKSVNAYNTLMDWGMHIMAGPTTSSASIAVSAECVNDKVFMLTPSGSDPKIIESGSNIFQMCFTDPNQGIGSADYLKQNNLGTKIGVIYDSSSGYSSGIYEKFSSHAKELGLNIVAAEAFTEDNKSDLSTQITKCQTAGCDLVFMPIYQGEAAQVLTYSNKIGYKPTFIGCDGMDGILTVENFDKSLAEGLILLTPFDATAKDEKTQNFVKKYTEKYGETPNQFAADAYDVAYSIYQACNNGKITADMSCEEMSEILTAQFTSMSFDGLTGQGMTWGQDGAVSKFPKAVKIQDGVYVGME